MLEEVREKSRTPLFLLLSFYTEVNYYQHFKVYQAFINRKLRLFKLLICCTELKLGLAPVEKLANPFIVNAMESSHTPTPHAKTSGFPSGLHCPRLSLL